MKLSKAIAEIQNEYGFTKEEEGDPRLAGIDRIAELDAQIRSRREELLAILLSRSHMVQLCYRALT